MARERKLSSEPEVRRKRDRGTVSAYAPRVLRCRQQRVVAALALGALGAFDLLACAAPHDPARPTATSQAAAGAAGSCPARIPATTPLPGTRPEHATLAYWLGRYSALELDTPLLSVAEIAAYNARVGRRPGGHRFAQKSLRVPPDRVELAHDLAGRLAPMRAKLDTAALVAADGQRLAGVALDAFAAPLPALELALHSAARDTQLRCGPHPGPLREGAGDPRYDRNACSAVRAREPVEVLARWDNGMWLARTRYAIGWLDADTALSPPVTAADREGLLGRTHPTDPRPLTRRALFTEAFDLLDSRYGFGDADGGRDCSRLQLDIFEHFDLALPRHSGWQAQAGNFQVDVSGVEEHEKLRLLDAVARDAAVLLAFPGHIMLYLGRNAEGAPMALHAIGEYVMRCASGGESIVTLDHAVVSDLELGRGSSRQALIERITTLVAIGRGPDATLAALARSVPAVPTRPDPGGTCVDTLDARIFVSPRQPDVTRPVRVIASANANANARDVQLWLWDPAGTPVDTTLHRLGGPPFTQHARVDAPAAGQWTAALARGAEVLACDRFRVSPLPLEPAALGTDAVWTPRWAWERDTENLWSAFIEQLFDYPPDDGRTWTNLHSLLRDRDRNLLYGHLGLDEDEQLEIEPDCADLPYVLRAYFAWKLALPYGYRQCSRGRTGHPPTCGALHTSLEPREATGDVEAFSVFVNRRVRSGVHSASGRTHPDDDTSDLYPVALERASLAPGTVYADPYGHVMVVTDWIEQGGDAASPYGILMAAEAQPDSTVGRRRFWEGAFLFDPSTADVGAGFKRFRPLTIDRAAGSVVALSNQELAASDAHVRFSRQQYAGSKEDFYEHVDALINPRPLAPAKRLASLVDALDESARRRVLAIDNAEQYIAGGGRMPMAMPVGHDIFETTGAWEDYATPSRDMRLLIAIDTVLALPERLQKRPQRFGVAPADTATAVATLRRELDAMLAARAFRYTRSDGAAQTLTLAEVVARREALEVAYNPNDCVELRWGAPPASAELAACKRRAPRDQEARMQKYRVWFHTRTRPARGTREP